MKAWKLVALVALVGLMMAACGSDSDGQTSTTTMPADEHSDGSDDATTTMPADGHSDGSDDVTTTMPADGHSHDGANDAIPWDGPTEPTVEVSVSGDPESGWDIVADITGLTFSDPTQEEHVPGQGHTHVFVDGALVSMGYSERMHISELEPGPHQATVTLSRNDHLDYSLDGELIKGTADFIVPGEVAPADVTFSVMYMDGSASGVDGPAVVSFGDIVEITVHSDVAEAVHVHGYDIMADVEEGMSLTIRFEADIPGVFDIELEESGVLLISLEVC